MLKVKKERKDHQLIILKNKKWKEGESCSSNFTTRPIEQKKY